MVVPLLGTAIAFAQNGAGSSSLGNSDIHIAQGTSELIFSEELYFGPNAYWEINGTVEIWSKKIWIAPTAKLKGTGKIIIHDPGTNPYYGNTASVSTEIDGNNGNTIEVDIELKNSKNLILANIPDPGFGTLNPKGPLSAALNVNAVFDFAIDKGDVILNGHDFRIGKQGMLKSYNSNRMVVTGNSLSGHLIKEFSGASPFVFPIGIAEEDYTPATLTPEKTAVLFASVQDYQTNAQQGLIKERGIDRVWHIYADQSLKADYTLQHRTITNGSSYIDDKAQIVQYTGNGNWVGGSTIVSVASIHSRSGFSTFADPANNGTWFTKLSPLLLGPIVANDKSETYSETSVQVNVLENDKPGNSAIIVSSLIVVNSCQYGQVKVNSDGSITYTSKPAFIGEDSFEYEITDENGMKSKGMVYITVKPKPIEVPNVFTPNNDGVNDKFVIVGLYDYDKIRLYIYNRWGNEVYKDMDYKNTWDGGNLNEGTYYYILELHKSGKDEVKKGWVLLKR